MNEKNGILGIDIGGTNIRFGLVDREKKILAYEHVYTADTFGSDTDPVRKLADTIEDFCRRNMDGKCPEAVSIGFPSTLNKDRTIVYQTPNIAVIPDNFDVVRPLSAKLGIPVFINRDVSNLLLFDADDLGVGDVDCVCGIYYGTGIGNAVMLNGRILTGHNGVASELGHLPMYGNRKVCTCGNEGCIESVVSGVALQRIRTESFPDVEIGDLFEKCLDTPQIQDFLTGMAQVVAIEENVFDPDCVVVGGGLLMMKGFPKQEFENRAHKYTRKPYPEKTMRILYSVPQQSNGVVGAAIYGFKRLDDSTYV